MTPLKKAIDEIGWKQADLARGLGIHKSRVSMIVNGKFNPDKRTRERIASFLGKPERELFKGA